MSEFHHEKLFEKNPQLISGNLQIIACAGAGKTEFVSERIAYQVFKGIAKPDQISAFTFTEKAAEELKFRIRSKIKTLIGKQTDIGDIYVGTIHAFAFRILQEFIPRYRAYDMLDEVGRLAFLSSIRRDIDLDYLTNSLLKRFSKPYGKNKQNWVFRTFIRDVDIFREEGLSLDCAVSDSFRNAYDVYLRKLEEKRFLDFSSILRITVNTLKQDKKVRDKVHSQFKFFTVDEYQDVNPIQEELIQLVSNKKNVCIVGDDDQSIYQWRGADTSNILTFRKRYKDVATHELLINRRSHDAIVKASSDLITTNKPRIPKSIRDKGTASEPGDLYKIVFDTQDQEIEWLLRRIQALVGMEYMDGETARKLKYSDMALLFRSISNEASPYIEALNAAGIPIVYSGTGGLFDTDEVACIIRTLEYISECDSDVDYSDLFLRSIHDDFSRLFAIPLIQFKNGVKKLKEWAKGQKRLSLQGLYGKILSLLGLSGPHFHEPEDDLLLYNLGRLSQAISDYENSREYLTFNSIKDFIWFIRLHAESSYDSGNTDAMAGLVDAVQIMTMHGTKGLGFPVVFMPSHFKRNSAPTFGPTYIDTEQVDVSRFLNHEQDERRLYYVAMTRAKKYLFITSAEYKVNGKRRGTRNILFDEIPGKYFIVEPTPDPTKRKPCNIDALSEEIRFPTNYSELAYYLSCGYDYKMRFLFGFNPGVVPQLGFGKQVHNVINLLHKEYEDTRKIPSKKRIQELLDEHFYLRYASDYVTNDLKNSARSSLERYVKMWEEDFTLSVKTERAFELEVTTCDFKLRQRDEKQRKHITNTTERNIEKQMDY
jgi:DNA helicase II / ATP-dependent DNA helicase PcrA